MAKERYFIGVDGGGTRCRVRLEDSSGRLLGEGESGPANIARDLTMAKRSIIDATNQAVSRAGVNIELSQIVVGAGLAGANIPSASVAIKLWEHPFEAIDVISDLHAACVGAHAGKAGAVIICGTGSTGTVFVNGVFKDFGGHGFLVGDVASGAWLGLEAIKYCLQALDGLEKYDEFSIALCEKLGANNSIDLVERSAKYTPSDYAALAPFIAMHANNGNKTANLLVAQATRYLQKLADKLIEDTQLPLALIGGLSQFYQSRFSQTIQARIVPCAMSPQQGAIQYIKQQIKFGEHEA